MTRVLALGLALAALCGCASAPPALRSTAAVTAAGDPQRQLVVTVFNPSAPAVNSGGSNWKRRGSAGAYTASASARRAVSELSRDYRLTPVAVWPIELLGVHCVVFELAPEQLRTDLLRMLAADPRVESVQPMQVFATLGSVVGTGNDDPYRKFQHGVASLQLEQAHRWAQGRGVHVGLIDTGVDWQHPELVGRVLAHADFVRAPGDEFRDDAHGTAVAGVIAAASNNTEGIVGVAPRAEIIALKACWPAPGGAQCNSFTLAAALAAAVARGSQVINLSLSGPNDPLLERLLHAALARGVLVVAALPEPARAEPMFPTSVAGVLVVGAAGARSRGGRGILLAPGVDILTTAPGGRYAFQSGSSVAAAHVTGVVALLLERRRDLSATAVTQLLSETSVVPPAVSHTRIGQQAAASVNACLALIALLRTGSCDESKAALELALKEPVQLPE